MMTVIAVVTRVPAASVPEAGALSIASAQSHGDPRTATRAKTGMTARIMGMIAVGTITIISALSLKAMDHLCTRGGTGRGGTTRQFARSLAWNRGRQ
ncbi:hypothetical protein BDU57DRAFT_517039 [Ampelomyces quisqualis]|uniref:Uncharacterized protein n=1 Tax=Ampelomyces quisqualis TaxID=50730 RepID=A0A6A5QPM7_AMPQU|nr:hypothetical protein BDU57DRAFT_517039 [Ampelomyces quisqualis]